MVLMRCDILFTELVIITLLQYLVNLFGVVYCRGGVLVYERGDTW